MMAIHEAGHCLGAIVTGARIVRVEIPLLGFSRTDVDGGSSRLAEVWAGPVFGALAPLLLLPLLRFPRRPLRHALTFYMGFSLLANGVYIGAGAFDRVGDCNTLLQYGSPLWVLVGFGAVCSASGFYIWHRMGAMRNWFTA